MMELTTNDFWAAWQAAQQLFPARMTRAFLHGMTGGALRSGSSPLLQSDIHGWLIPGLALCGIQAELLPLSSEASEWLPLLRDQLCRHASVPLLTFAALPEKTNSADDTPIAQITSKARSSKSHALHNKREVLEIDAIELPPADALLHSQALLTALDVRQSSLTLTMQDGTQSIIRTEDLQVSYSHVLLLQRAPQRQPRSVHVRAAIRQWAVFACACPERVCTTNPADALIRALASEFWRELAGKQRSADFTRLRHLAYQFETATRADDLHAAFALLYELACASFTLPQEVENALLAPSTDILTDSERRELIYLCRAGTRDIKILAAHRLFHEREHADARSTLQQLRCDMEAWVRRVAGG